MVKKILFISILCIATAVFSQQKSIEKLSASPNPFSNSTAISFEIHTSQNVSITIKNVLGKVVYVKKIDANAGKNNIQFQRNNLKSGMYIYTIQTNKDFISKRLVIK